jgi:hypothetical protein
MKWFFPKQIKASLAIAIWTAQAGINSGAISVF